MPSTSGGGPMRGDGGRVSPWPSLAASFLSFLEAESAADPGFETAATTHSTPSPASSSAGEAEVAALVGRERRPGNPSIHPAISPPGLPGNLLVTASPVSASRAQTVVDLRWTSIPNAVEYFGMGASQPRCGAAAPMALRHHCRSPDPRSRAGAPALLAPLGLGHSVCRCQAASALLWLWEKPPLAQRGPPSPSPRWWGCFLRVARIMVCV